MKKTSTLSVFATTYGVFLALTLLYAVLLCVHHGNLMYLRLWGILLVVAFCAAPLILLFAMVVSFLINLAAASRDRD